MIYVYKIIYIYNDSEAIFVEHLLIIFSFFFLLFRRLVQV